MAIPLAKGADKKPQPVPLLVRPNQSVEIMGMKVPAASQPCANWGWAVAVELMLRAQGVSLDQKFWVTKADGGEACVAELRPMEELARVVDGEYLLDVNRKVRLQAQVTTGAPRVPDELIVRLREGMPLLFLWNGHPFVMYGLVYDEYIGPNNARIFQIREIKLLDPLVNEGDAQRRTSFVRERDDAAQIDGVLSVQATPVE